MRSFLPFVFLFPGSQDTGKRKEKNAENTACEGCGPEEFGGNTGVDQTEINQDEHRRDPDDSQDDRYDIKRYLKVHGGSFPDLQVKKIMQDDLSIHTELLYHLFRLFQVPESKERVFC